MIKSNAVALAAKPVSIAPASLSANTKALADRQAIVDVTGMERGNPAITPVYPGKVIDFMPIPRRITITVENTNTSGGDLEIKILNNDTFVALPSGVTVANSSGFSGKLLDKLIASVNQSQGLLIYGFNVTGYNSAGDKSDDVLNEAALELRYYNGYGTSYVPVQIDVSGAERNTQFKDGLLTVKTRFMLNMLTQFKLNLGQEEKLQFVFFTEPLQD